MPELAVVPLGRSAGADIEGMDLAKRLSAAEVLLIKYLLARYGVLRFRQQHLTEDQQLTFTRSLGRVARHPMVDFSPDDPKAASDPYVSYMKDVPGLEYAGKAQRRGAVGWHTDLSYMPEPGVYSVLYGIDIPSRGGDTLFSNLAAAYDALDPPDQWTLENLSCVHWIAAERRPVIHPLVRIHPISLRKSIFLSPTVSRRAVGLGERGSRLLLGFLTRHCTGEQLTWRHAWQPHDVLVWDNRLTMHARGPFDILERRVMRRTHTVGEAVIPARAGRWRGPSGAKSDGVRRAA